MVVFLAAGKSVADRMARTNGVVGLSLSEGEGEAEWLFVVTHKCLVEVVGS